MSRGRAFTSAALFAGIAALVLGTGLPVDASTRVSHTSFNGLEAQAQFNSTDGCLDTFVFLLVDEGQFRERNGAPRNETQIAMEIQKYDHCTLQVVFHAYSISRTLPDAAFQADRTLASATLTATVRFEDALNTGSTFLVDVNVSWTGTGPVITDKTHDVQRSDGETFVYNSHRSFRDATATGTVRQGPSTVASGDAVFGRLTNVHSSGVSIVRS